MTYAESLFCVLYQKGLFDDLKVAIIVRGITDTRIRAAATNAKLKITDLVEFLLVPMCQEGLYLLSSFEYCHECWFLFG